MQNKHFSFIIKLKDFLSRLSIKITEKINKTNNKSFSFIKTEICEANYHELKN